MEELPRLMGQRGLLMGHGWISLCHLRARPGSRACPRQQLERGASPFPEPITMASGLRAEREAERFARVLLPSQTPHEMGHGETPALR